MEEELKDLAQKLLEECGIDVTEEEEEAAPSVFDDIKQAVNEARRQCVAQGRAYSDAKNVARGLKEQEPQQLATWERLKSAMEEIQPEYDELVELREEQQLLRLVKYQTSMTDEEKREVQEDMNRLAALDSYIVRFQEIEVTRSLQKWNVDSYEKLKSSHDRVLAALEDTRGRIPAVTATKIRAYEDWIRCQREYLLEQARRNGWRESDLRVDYGHLFW